MSQITAWLALEPVDSLTFRGSETMVAGESHEATTLFPPLPSTLTGALRSAVLMQQGIAPREYLDAPADYAADFPLLGSPEKPGFSLVGPLFMVGNTPLFPAPGHWFKEKVNVSAPRTKRTTIRVQTATPIPDQYRETGITGSVRHPFWVTGPEFPEKEPMTAYWVNAQALQEAKRSRVFALDDSLDAVAGPTAAAIPLGELYGEEIRYGIALEEGLRRVREGHLFSSRHIRLKTGVYLLIGIITSSLNGLQPQGILQLGGEQRICRYQLLDNLELPHNPDGELLMTLSPVESNRLPETLRNSPRAGGQLLRIGGWDMAKGFHKPTLTLFPAGTVFRPPAVQDYSRPGFVVI